MDGWEAMIQLLGSRERMSAASGPALCLARVCMLKPRVPLGQRSSYPCRSLWINKKTTCKSRRKGASGLCSHAPARAIPTGVHFFYHVTWFAWSELCMSGDDVYTAPLDTVSLRHSVKTRVFPSDPEERSRVH